MKTKSKFISSKKIANKRISRMNRDSQVAMRSLRLYQHKARL